MPTDEERREVARRLKSIRGLDCCKDPRYAVELASDAIGASHSNGYSWDKMLDRLADLIEPPARCPHYMYPCCRTDAGGDYIDRDALLALADEMKRKAQEYVERFDENSSTASVLNGYARRIREALGYEKTERELQG